MLIVVLWFVKLHSWFGLLRSVAFCYFVFDVVFTVWVWCFGAITGCFVGLVVLW